MKRESLCKTPKVVGKISDHQWGTVFSRGGVREHSNIFSMEIPVCGD